MIVPDIKSGYIINAIGEANQWQTFIESCLMRGPQVAYLATSCRSERMSPYSIFNSFTYEAALAHTWNGSFTIRSGPGAKRRWSKANFRSITQAPMVDVTVLPFEELLATLQSGQARDNFIYMEIKWGEHRLICPCQYLNNGTQYIQPISGPVLVDRGKKLYMAYVAAHVTEKGTQRVEFILRTTTSILNLNQPPFSLAPKGILRYTSHKLFKLLTIPFTSMLLTDEFNEVVSSDATCTFFTYND